MVTSSDDLTDDAIVDRIIADIAGRTSESGKFALFGNSEIARNLALRISQGPFADAFLGCYHNNHSDYDDLFQHSTQLTALAIENILLCASLEDMRHSLRLLCFQYATTANVVYPWLSAGSWSLWSLEDPSPIITLTHPCAGSHRFIFPFRKICEQYGRLNKTAFQPTLSPRFIAQHLRHGEYRHPRQEDIDRSFLDQTRQLEYFQIFDIHQSFTIELLREASDCKIIALLRDPRDIVTSYYFRRYIKKPTDDEAIKEERILKLLDGNMSRISSEYFIRWPAITAMAQNFVEARRNPNCHTISFEDMHLDTRGAFKDLLDWLGFSKEGLTFFNDQHLDEAIHLGTFEHQTGGKRKRGSEDIKVHHENGVQTSCRKGVPGDWRNHFSPRVKDRVKELIGAELIDLGYERDLNW